MSVCTKGQGCEPKATVVSSVVKALVRSSEDLGISRAPSADSNPGVNRPKTSQTFKADFPKVCLAPGSEPGVNKARP